VELAAFEPTFVSRAERKFRRIVLLERDADCSVLKERADSLLATGSRSHDH
jgi:hypothetical protein